jgi:hypothetical protein
VLVEQGGVEDVGVGTEAEVGVASGVLELQITLSYFLKRRN